MRLATYSAGGDPRVGVVARDETVIPVDDLVPGLGRDMLELIDAGPAAWERLRQAAESAAGGTALRDVLLLAPIPRPRRDVMCVGWNYSEHFTEGKGMRGPGDDAQQLPEFPALFSKMPTTVVGPGAPVWHPAPTSDQLDWEAELAVVVGQGGRDLSQDRALDHVFGYTVANDVSVRDVQRRHGGQWFKGKNFDTHCPLGPWIVTADEIADPHTLRISSRINGVTKQDSTTRFMVFRVPRILHELSLGLVLQPGDVILTGTPEGVGFARTPPEFLSVGDVMEMEVERIGVLRNPVSAYTSHGGGATASNPGA